ncbi:MAG TPA: hypothetical protein VK543_02390 [Puia sp.]|nr:hypothetical protein [Puia sp.]
MRFFGIVFLFLFPYCLVAEDLTGIWKGRLTQEPGGCYSQYSVEFQINFSNNTVTGRVYDYYDTVKYVKLSLTGTYNPLSKRLVLTEQKVLQYSIPPDCIPCIKTYELQYSNNGKDEILSGEWKGHIMERQKNCPPGKIILKKAALSDFPVDIEQTDSLARIQELLHLENRTKDVVKTVFVDVPQIKIELYDNAEIDNDTITVFVNDKMLLYRQRLTEKPLTLYVNAFPGLAYELVMYADNLGLIPPNTALMVVTAGNKKMDVFLSSSEQKSATVRFVYRKPE